MSQTLEAIFDGKVFRPAVPVVLKPNTRVRITIEPDKQTDVLELAAEVYNGLSDEQAREVEEIALDRRDSFDGTQP